MWPPRAKAELAFEGAPPHSSALRGAPVSLAAPYRSRGMRLRPCRSSTGPRYAAPRSEFQGLRALRPEPAFDQAHRVERECCRVFGFLPAWNALLWQTDQGNSYLHTLGPKVGMIYAHTNIGMCIHINAYVHVTIHIYICIYIYTYICIHIYIYIYRYTYMYLEPWAQGPLCSQDHRSLARMLRRRPLRLLGGPKSWVSSWAPPV